jgi:hypothetical protein
MNVLLPEPPIRRRKTIPCQQESCVPSKVPIRPINLHAAQPETFMRFSETVPHQPRKVEVALSTEQQLALQL